ncbi:OprO/OprP family phosphate-selective porin [Flavobacterium beibuense]|uniref:Phosphate-selective porin O and P n=1 Tax=Flavobacterium beibuense TaxID=657326 RepID=A0A444WC25_9FLAO|nr:porin [Flavobacterium beibuense]RYJ43366.1 Phosphate-selective porin O and P [Flavobacterium beibuense]
MKKTLSLLLFFVVVSAFSQSSEDTTFVKVRYGHKGFEFNTSDNKFLLQIQGRLQLRLSTPGDQDPVTYDDYLTENKTAFKINRARLKIGGHAYEPWLKYYFEYELSQSNLLDFRIMLEKWEFLSFKAGQWKVEFTRERFISSGEQQMVDRSLINREFTLDRQQGLEVYGHLKGKGILDFNYWAATLTGTGRGSTTNDDNNIMYFGRAQWNFLGREVGFEGSDLEFHEKPAAYVAFAVATNQSPYTRFSQAGGGYLTSFEDGEPGQYRVNQTNLESAFLYKGFSAQTEWHHKDIIDKLNGNATTQLRGYYVQGGYFFHYLFDWFPKKMEIAARYAEFKPDTDLPENLQTETSIACNWFFHGHKCKLTCEGSYFSYQDRSLPYEGGWRFRLQLDFSF